MPREEDPVEKKPLPPGVTVRLEHGGHLVLRRGSVTIRQRRTTQEAAHDRLVTDSAAGLLWDAEVEGLPAALSRQILTEFVDKAGLVGPFREFLQQHLLALKGGSDGE